MPNPTLNLTAIRICKPKITPLCFPVGWKKKKVNILGDFLLLFIPEGRLVIAPDKKKTLRLYARKNTRLNRTNTDRKDQNWQFFGG